MKIKSNKNTCTTKRVFARLISREVTKNDLKHISGGDDHHGGGDPNKYGWYITDNSHFKGWDCCK